MGILTNTQTDLLSLNKEYQSLQPRAKNLAKNKLFGTDGIRGKAGELLNASFALEVGFHTGKILEEAANSKGAVIIGQDSRNSSDMLAMGIAAGLTSAGLEVWHLGLCPTPCVAYLTATTEAIGGIMISASHNPPSDNGIKFFGRDGIKLSSPYTEIIEEKLTGSLLASATTTQMWGKHYYRPDLVANYLQGIKQSLPKNASLAGVKIVLDLAWGASAHIGGGIFKDLGAEVICLNDQANGDRINVNCGSTHLEQLQAAVKEHKADLGFAFDGDADRVMAVDNQGRPVNGDYILYLWGKELQEKNSLPESLIVGTVMANLGFELAWQQQGGKLIRTAVGDQYVQQEMWRSGAMLGGEQSGHILCHHHSVSGDGLQTALHLTYLVLNSGVNLAKLLDDSFQTYPQILRNVEVEDRHRRLHWLECEALGKAITQAEKTMGSQGRVLVRASGTEPVIRVMVESASGEEANYWTEKLVNLVQLHLA